MHLLADVYIYQGYITSAMQDRFSYAATIRLTCSTFASMLVVLSDFFRET